MVTVSILSLGLALAIDISVVIPSNNSLRELLQIVHAVCRQSVKPAEIVIVDSSVVHITCPPEIKSLVAGTGIKLLYEYRAFALPGHARNIGLRMASSEVIAFVDVQTIPSFQWLETSLDLLVGNGADGVWGSTSFRANTVFERLVRDGFYGTMPRKTLPGSIFKREVFERVGQFIDWARAGEDTEWLLRLELFKIPLVSPSSGLIDYVGLIGLDAKKLLKKWYRNYAAARDLPHFFPHRLLMWVILYPLIVFIAFNWNYIIAEWRMDSPLYIGHVTKFAALLPGLTYLLVRGLVMPFYRGVGFWQLLPIRFLLIAVVCLVADFVKVFLISLPRR